MKRYLTIFTDSREIVAAFIVNGDITDQLIIRSGYNIEWSTVEPSFRDHGDGKVTLVTNKKALGKA